jgi:hypothetical protein
MSGDQERTLVIGTRLSEGSFPMSCVTESATNLFPSPVADLSRRRFVQGIALGGASVSPRAQSPSERWSALVNSPCYVTRSGSSSKGEFS